MGLLLNVKTGERIVLRGNHVFGRNPLRSDTFLDDAEVSLMHAVARWRDGRWLLTDHSRNGSFIDGRALLKGQPTPLARGEELRFGSAVGSVWCVLDIEPPGVCLLPIDPTREVRVLAPHNLLPTADAPELFIFETEPGHWLLEQHGDTRPLTDGDTLCLDGALYRFLCAAEIEETNATTSALNLEPPLLRFRLSLDEEHTWLDVHCGSHHADLGERIHHYCLATLARRRLADSRAGFEPSAQGWLGSAHLARMLGVEVTHLNILVFRARDQLMAALPAVTPLALLVERRRGELRLGEFAFEIRRGTQCEGSYRPLARCLSASAIAP
jgi:hypothetical protein